MAPEVVNAIIQSLLVRDFSVFAFGRCISISPHLSDFGVLVHSCKIFVIVWLQFMSKWSFSEGVTEENLGFFEFPQIVSCSFVADVTFYVIGIRSDFCVWLQLFSDQRKLRLCNVTILFWLCACMWYFSVFMKLMNDEYADEQLMVVTVCGEG